MATTKLVAKKSAPAKKKTVHSGKKISETLHTDKQNLINVSANQIGKETIFSDDDREKIKTEVKKVLQSVGSEAIQIPVVLTYDDLRTINKAEFKKEISGAIVQFEVNKKRIEVEEMLATGGNVYYTTDKLKKDCGCNQKKKPDITSVILSVALDVALFAGLCLAVNILLKNDSFFNKPKFYGR